jgi:hypothetical protein
LKTYRTDFRSLSLNESMELIRAERNLILNETVDRLNPIRWAELSDAKKAEWTTFRKQLLSITERLPRIDYVTWPDVPSDKETIVETPVETP